MPELFVLDGDDCEGFDAPKFDLFERLALPCGRNVAYDARTA